MISYADFEKIDIRVGRIVRAEDFAEARKPAYKLWIDFGPEIGEKRSSAQITAHYQPNALVGTLVLGVVNLGARQVGPFVSEILTVGVPDERGDVVLVRPDHNAPLGSRLF